MLILWLLAITGAIAVVSLVNWIGFRNGMHQTRAERINVEVDIHRYVEAIGDVAETARKLRKLGDKLG